MGNSTGKIAFIFLFASALSVLGAWLLAWRFRAAMRLLMSRPVADAPPSASPPSAALTLATANPVSASDNRRAGWHLAATLIGLSTLIAISSAALQLAFMRENLVTPARTLTIALAYLWPVIPVLGQAWRWTRLRVFAALALWCLAVVGVLIWRQVEANPTQAVVFLALEVGPSIVLVFLICMGNAARAIAPLLLLPFLGLTWAVIAGIDVLDLVITQRAAWLEPLHSLTGQTPLLFFAAIVLIFLVLPCVLAWWPLKWLARWVAAAYARQWLSELMVLFTIVWSISLLEKTLGWIPTLGFGATLMLLPLLWIPVVMLTLRHLRRREGRPPTLLVLRVFQRDRAVRELFDSVIERWRLTGNTVLIAGTDLIERTLDAGDIFSFVDGGLAERFIRHTGQISARIAGFDLDPDAEGRYRVNECYCHDTTWRETLAALLARTDVVLMDLRGFHRRNEGCAFELGELARAPGLARAVVLVDGQTDMAAAKTAAATAPTGRFLWLDTKQMNRARQREVLSALFVSSVQTQDAPLHDPHVEPRRA